MFGIIQPSGWNLLNELESDIRKVGEITAGADGRLCAGGVRLLQCVGLLDAAVRGGGHLRGSCLQVAQTRLIWAHNDITYAIVNARLANLIRSR